MSESYSSANDDYSTLRAMVVNRRCFERDDWRITARTRTVLTSTPQSFRVQAIVDAWEGDTRIFSRDWDEEIPRDHV